LKSSSSIKNFGKKILSAGQKWPINTRPILLLRLIRVLVTGQLKDLTKGAREVDLETAGDLSGVVRDLDASFPGIGRKIVDDQGRIRRYVNVFVNAENAKSLENEKTRLRDGDVVHILPSVAGG